jgi:hypothetical protein
MREEENRRGVVMIKRRGAVPDAQDQISSHHWRSGQGQEVWCTFGGGA